MTGIHVRPDQLLRFVRPSSCAYPAALDDMQAIFDRYGISANALRAAHFSAQIMHESGGLRFTEENLAYRATRLVQVWPNWFLPHGPLDPQQYADKPEALANRVYGGRNGNVQDGDGYRFRGRGLLQLTFRDNYREATTALRSENPSAPDLCATPDLACGAKWALEVAAAVWRAAGCNRLADQDNLDQVTRAVNGALNGIRERRAWLSLMKTAYLSR